MEKLQQKSNQELLKEKQTLKEQIETLTDSLEMVTLDKEIAEEKAEQLEQELEQLKQKIKVLEINEETKMETNSPLEDVQSLQLQNEKLKDALMKLRDLTVTEKQEKEKIIKELEKENKQLLPFKGKS